MHINFIDIFALIEMTFFGKIVYEREHIKRPYETPLRLNSPLSLPTQL